MVKWQKGKKTNNDRHNITQKTTDRSTRISLKSHQSNHIITDGFRLNLMKDNLNETKCQFGNFVVTLIYSESNM
jgi:hypothetical protein